VTEAGPEPAPADLLVEGCLLLSPGAEPLPSARIAVRGDRIAAIGPAEGPPPPARRTIRAEGLVALPGLVNTHTHAVLCLMRGVAEDMGFAPAYTRGVPRAPMISPGEAVALARLGALEALRLGSTLICDTYVHARHTIPAMAELGLRVAGCTLLHDVDFAGMPDGRWDYDAAIGERALAEAVEIAETLHGSAEGRVTATIAPHAPDTCSTAFLGRVAREAERLGLRTAIHLAQSPIEVERVRARDGCTPVELVDAVGLLDGRLTAAHGICMSAEDRARAGRAGIHLAHVPKGNAGGGMMAPTQALRAAGVNLALATDNLLADMIEAMRWALCIGRLQTGRVEPDWQPAEVFAMATAGGAAAMGMEGEIGVLAPGAKADIVLLDATGPQFVPMLDPLGVLVHCAQGAGVVHVLVDGRPMIAEGRHAFADEAAIRADAQRAAEALWARARGH
jgi:5-methylthioadenosine/S-adenosylhomocysteine deaminase